MKWDSFNITENYLVFISFDIFRRQAHIKLLIMWRQSYQYDALIQLLLLITKLVLTALI